MNGAESLIRTVAAAGVDVCFANPGTSEMHFVAALDDVPEMRAVLTLFEGVGHDTWDVVYDPRRRFDPRTGKPDPDGVNVYQWLLMHHR